MRIWNGIELYPEDAAEVVGTIGNYDGVHLGHRAILQRVVEEAGRRRLPSLLISFDPHPLKVVAPERQLLLLQTRRQKLDELERSGIDALLLLRFDDRLAELTSDDFFGRLLDERVRFASIVVGENFRFGQARGGDLAALKRIGERRGFEACGVRPVRVDERIVSSSAIRTAVRQGEVEWARRLLGRPFSVTGEVVRGEGRGRKMRWPTANVELDNEILPRRGVYITESVALAHRYASVTNIGVRPTFMSEFLTVETHLLDFEEDLYRERVEIRFLARLRDEMRFLNTAELADQIARDCAAAEMYFQSAGSLQE